MKTKAFDCVAMKRAGAAAIYRKMRGMTRRQKLEFWKRESAALVQEQQAAKARQAARRPRHK
jgi:hypothetical protein